ncbi:MAG: aldolase/citrate lyase family protein, partial [Mesorhizobium sp.]|nr:aldolase/citrate lyase family protein [Mesorhizobium sp.]
LKTANSRTFAIAMIETRAAVDALDGILATPGIDGIFLGPSDFSIAWTRGEMIDTTLEDMMATIADIAARAEAAGKFCGIYIIDPAVSGRMVKMGYRLLALGSEHKLISLGAEVLLKSVRDAID